MFHFATHKNRNGRAALAWGRRSLRAFPIFFLLAFSACNELERPKSEPYYAGTVPPRKQEFRWSNGKMPKSLDPARAAAPPETDLVRAVFEGLTEIDPSTLEVRSGVAERWTSSEDHKTWTFHLRGNARWSNGRSVTADDFERSWRRLGEIRGAVAYTDLLTNIVGFPIEKTEAAPRSVELLPNLQDRSLRSLPASPLPSVSPEPHNSNPASPERDAKASLFGATALDPRTLQVQLVAPDKDLPKLLAHPIFRPIFGDGSEFTANPVGTAIVTNGAFAMSSIDEVITLERSETYWNKGAIKLERVIFVPNQNAEQALAAYKAGEIDAITNVDFAPLALKLLEPFEDFRRRTHAALNFYEINHEKAPFDDRRVREALAISIERERLTEGEMEGQTQPALSFLPFTGRQTARIIQDKERARELLDEAGFPNGQGFPLIKLLVNRNDTQQRVARAIAAMWKQSLNLETEIVVKEIAELEQMRISGDFDLVRRGVVFPTADELMSILTLLKPAKASPEQAPKSFGEGVEAADPRSKESADDPAAANIDSPDITMSETNAIYELWAIPLYFPTSYSLVKPYVTGFEMNSLDAPSLSDVNIDSNWQPK